MKMKKRILSLLLVVVMTIAIVMTGCGSGDSGGGSTSDKTLTVAIWDNNQMAGLKEIADEWSKTSGYEVEFTAPDWDSYWTMLEAGVSGGEMPDVFWMHSNNADKYMGADILLNLNDYIADDDAIDLDNYFEGITDLYRMDDVQYAIPKDHDTIAVVYNKKIFDKYKVDYPSEDWTWDDFAEAAQKISNEGKEDGVYGTYCNVTSDQDGWYNIVYSYGGEVITPNQKSSGLDEPATIEAMKFVAEEILPACPPPDSMASTGGDTMFLSGLVGMICQGSWTVNNFYTADNASDYAWALLPYADVNGNGQCEPSERCSIYNGLGWCISSQSEKADAAWSLISAFTCEEGQNKQSELGITMAAYKGCSDAFTEAYDGMDISPFVDIEEKGTLLFRPSSKSTALWREDISDALVDVWSNPEKMEDVLKELAVQMNQTISEE